MPRIPEYNEQYRYAGRAGNLGGRLNPGDYGGTAGAIGASGQIAGQQWQQAGAALTKAANPAAVIYDDYNTNKAQQAVSGLQKNFLAWQSEMSKNKGEAGMDAGAQYEQWQKKQVAELTKGMNDIQRGRFNALAEVKAAGFRQWAADYGSEQGLVFRNAEDVAGIKASGEVLVANLTNPSIANPAIDSIRKNAKSIANRKGLGEAARAQFIKDALSESITPAIAAQIDAGKLSTARTALLHYKDKIGVANALKLQAAIQREGRRLEAEARAEQERAETQRALGSVASLLQDTAGMPQDKRESAIMDAIAQEPDIKRRQRMASVAMGELAFQARRLDAQNAAAGRALAEKVKDMSPLERSANFQENGGSQEAINNAVKILSTGMMTDPVAMSQAKSAIAAGEDVDEVLAKYPTTINARDAEELRSFSADKARKSAHRRLTAWFDEMALKSGLDKKNDEDAQFLAESKTIWIEMIENGAFKTVEDQKNWIWERLAKRVNPGGWLGIWDQSVSPRKARDKADAYISEVPPWEAENIRRQLVRNRGVSNPTPKQIQEVYDAQRKQGQGRSEEITPLTPIYW